MESNRMESNRLESNTARLLLRAEISELLDDYSRCLDDGRLDEWPGFFLDDALYNILPRENFEENLFTSLLYLDSNAMRRDRVMCIRDVIIHQRAHSRHLVSGLQIIEATQDAISSVSNFAVMHSDSEGYSKLFATGEYRDRVRRVEGKLKFSERIVLLDSFTIDSQLVDPL